MPEIKPKTVNFTVDLRRCDYQVVDLFKSIGLPQPTLPGQPFTQGITNVLVRYDDLLVRVNGNSTSLLIDREGEYLRWKALEKHGLAGELIAKFDNGYVYRFRPGVVLGPEDLSNPYYAQRIATTLARWHTAVPLEEFGYDPGAPMSILRDAEKWMKLVADGTTGEKFPLAATASEGERIIEFGLSDLIKAYERVVSSLKASQECFTMVPCHNDLLCRNIIYDRDSDRVNFIDYEYAGVNPMEYDIANHFNEFVGFECDWERLPTEDFMREWCANYVKARNALGKRPALDDIDSMLVRVRTLMKTSHLLWCLWAICQARYSSLDFGFWKYAALRFRGYMMEVEREGSRDE